MKINLDGNIDSSERRSTDFAEKVKNFIEDSLVNSLKNIPALSNLNIIHLKHLEIGVMSYVFVITSPETDQRFILKFVEDITAFWNEVASLKLCEANGVNSTRIIHYESIDDNLHLEIQDFIDAPILENVITEKAIEMLGRELSKLQGIKLHGFGYFKSNEYECIKDKFQFNLDDINWNIVKEYGFSDNEIEKIKNLISQYNYDGIGVLTHGDIDNENVFFDGNQVILYDFNGMSMDPMYDIAYYRLKMNDDVNLYGSFLNGFGREKIDQRRLNLITLYFCCRKLVSWKNLEDDMRKRWAEKFLRTMLTEFE